MALLLEWSPDLMDELFDAVGAVLNQQLDLGRSWDEIAAVGRPDDELAVISVPLLMVAAYAAGVGAGMAGRR